MERMGVDPPEEGLEKTQQQKNGQSKCQSYEVANDYNLDRSHKKSSSTSSEEIIVKIVSAYYGPCEGRRLLTGELSNDETASIPVTRDVAPFLRALLVAQQYRENTDEEQQQRMDNNDDDEEEEVSDPYIVRMNAVAQVGGMKRAKINVSDAMKSMNALFGDPCPGTSKRLYVNYTVSENTDSNASRAASTEVHHMSFAEHEKVVLKRRTTYYQEDSKLKQATARALAKQSQLSALIEDVDDEEEDDDEDAKAIRVARRMGRAQSIAEFAELTMSAPGMKASSSKSNLLGIPEAPSSLSSSKVLAATSPESILNSNPPRRWRLRSAASEIVLPIVMPFLDVRERVMCQLVCRLWRFVIRDWGIATTIDNNDASFPRFTRPFFRGLLSHSYASLHSLYLSGFEDLQQSDLHPSIPYLRKLRSLDISRCVQLDDSTLTLLSEHTSDTLEVLYMKGLRRVTDEGLISICQSCSKLKVLEISNIPITDRAGVAIGENSTLLTALYMRDNYLLTNRSIDAITENCTSLEQLTLWGCTRLQHLSFDQPDESGLFISGKLVMLNLWGCHSLRDDSADALAGMNHLRSLIVSECHRLTDTFVTSLCQVVPQLHHLHLRYCKRITDTAVNTITQNLQDLYSLDLSFCTKISATALFNLLEIRGDSLAELRIQSCRKLDIARGPNAAPVRHDGDQIEGGNAGRQILNALRAHGAEGCLSVLDVRHCGGQPGPSDPFPDKDPFVQGMLALGFEQKVPGYFARPARWNSEVERRLVEQLILQSAT